MKIHTHQSPLFSRENFIHDDFLLDNEYAVALYHDYARDMPIIDYHCHLPPKDIAENRIFKNITEIWIHGDHYKWRAMRTLGINEKYITGDASDNEKFKMWACAVPLTMRNPLYHWTHLELARYFDINELLNENSADEIYQETGAMLSTDKYSTQNLLKKMNVKVVCTTEDPVDSLEFHRYFATSNIETKISTCFRPDKSLAIESPEFNDYLDKLGKAAQHEIGTYDDLCLALQKRMEFFNKMGCKLSDHGIAQIYSMEFKESEVRTIFEKRRKDKKISEEEALIFKSALLLFLGESYHALNWVQQFHLGAMRNNNSRMYQSLGADTGWDSVGDFSQARQLATFLDALDKKDKLTKTILYNLNPGDNEVIATMLGNFNDGKIKGKIQMGSGWWFLDQKDGMIRQMNALSNMGLISCFIGMITDSRSFLSYPRHEYFRRILCNLFGDEIQRGELPADLDWIGQIIKNICYYNAKDYFDF